jgi:hypothetical protein
MNWDAIGAVGEIVGALAVVVTLIYVSKQIRQGARSVSIAALRDTTAQWNQWGEMLATAPDLAAIVAKGNRAYESLSDTESLRYGAFVQSFFDNVESYRILVSDHKIEKDLTVLESIVARRIQIPGFSMWWSENTDDYSDDFVEWIERIRRTAE